MTKPLIFNRCTAPVQTILPPLTEQDRIKAYLRTQAQAAGGTWSELQLNQFLRGYDLVSIARRQLGMDKGS